MSLPSFSGSLIEPCLWTSRLGQPLQADDEKDAIWRGSDQRNYVIKDAKIGMWQFQGNTTWKEYSNFELEESMYHKQTISF